MLTQRVHYKWVPLVACISTNNRECGIWIGGRFNPVVPTQQTTTGIAVLIAAAMMVYSRDNRMISRNSIENRTTAQLSIRSERRRDSVSKHHEH